MWSVKRRGAKQVIAYEYSKANYMMAYRVRISDWSLSCDHGLDYASECGTTRPTILII